jgi:predicted O-methyltransferase YrrM
MPRDFGEAVYEHVRATRPRNVLELGTAHGVSSAYISAALEANGEGVLTSVDSSHSRFTDPTPEQLLEKAGLLHRVQLDRTHSIYTWWLKEAIERQTHDGACIPIYDFVFLDGAHNWTIDGCAVFLIEKLLKPGGWLLLDDLDWTYAGAAVEVIGGVDTRLFSPTEKEEPHVRAVFDLVLEQHPSFSEFRIQDERWGWAQKGPGEARHLVIETSMSFRAVIVSRVRRVERAIRRSRRRRVGAPIHRTGGGDPPALLPQTHRGQRPDSPTDP